MLLTALTPLGGRELSVKGGMMKSLFFMPAGQFTMLLALTILLVVLLTRRRLRRRAGMFGYQGKDIPGWIAAMLLVIAIPGALHLPTYLSRYGFFAWVLIPALWLVVVAVRALFGKKERVLPRLVVSNVLLVSLGVAVLCIAPMVWWFGHASESWFRKDRFMKISPEAPGMTPYEYWATQAFHAETRRMFGAD
ncbi:MAG TPA: hypothetical protein VM511_08835 [Luteolibacter sp.]|nr:hypothetical protein [Luteolibacter sp.]